MDLKLIIKNGPQLVILKFVLLKFEVLKDFFWNLISLNKWKISQTLKPLNQKKNETNNKLKLELLMQNVRVFVDVISRGDEINCWMYFALCKKKFDFKLLVLSRNEGVGAEFASTNLTKFGSVSQTIWKELKSSRNGWTGKKNRIFKKHVFE